MVAIPSSRAALSRFPVTLKPDADVFEAIDLLVKRKVTGAPVVDGTGALVGVLTAKDCLRVCSNATWEEMPGGSVRDFMSVASAVIDVELDALEAATRFLDTNFPVLPVVDGKRVLGEMRRPELLECLYTFGVALEKERRRREKKALRRGDHDQVARLEAAATLAELSAVLGS